MVSLMSSAAGLAIGGNSTPTDTSILLNCTWIFTEIVEEVKVEEQNAGHRYRRRQVRV